MSLLSCASRADDSGVDSIMSCSSVDLGTPSQPQSLRLIVGQSRLLGGLQALWQWLQREGGLKIAARQQRRMRVSETVSLGEKRFVSIVDVDGVSFLIGGSTSSVSLLTALPPRSENASVEDLAWPRIHAKETHA